MVTTSLLHVSVAFGVCKFQFESFAFMTCIGHGFCGMNNLMDYLLNVQCSCAEYWKGACGFGLSHQIFRFRSIQSSKWILHVSSINDYFNNGNKYARFNMWNISCFEGGENVYNQPR